MLTTQGGADEKSTRLNSANTALHGARGALTTPETFFHFYEVQQVAARKKKITWQKAGLTLFGAILLGAVGSGTWELLAKPGLNSLGRFLLNTITFGSTAIKDSAYSGAALNPTAVPSLMLVIAFWCIPATFSVLSLLSIWVAPFLRKRPPIAQDTEAKRLRRLSRLRRYRAFLHVPLILLLLTQLVVAAVFNQSVLVWRVFHSNLAICSPYMTDSEYKRLEAKFASMTTRQEYLLIDQELETIAQKNDVKLRAEAVW